MDSTVDARGAMGPLTLPLAVAANAGVDEQEVAARSRTEPPEHFFLASKRKREALATRDTQACQRMGVSMNQQLLSWGRWIILGTTLFACSDDGEEATSSSGFLRGPLPTEQTLCRLAMGTATVSGTRAVLGEPTDITSAADTTTLGYYWGSMVNLEAFALLSFDQDGYLASAALQNIQFPQCWRDQLATLEASEAERNPESGGR